MVLEITDFVVIFVARKMKTHCWVLPTSTKSIKFTKCKMSVAVNLMTEPVSTSEDEAVELGYQDEVVDLSKLQQFEVTKKPRRRKKDQIKGGGQKHQKSPANDMIGEFMKCLNYVKDHKMHAFYVYCVVVLSVDI